MKGKGGAIIKLGACKPFLSGDRCRLREMLRPGAANTVRYSLAHATVRPGVTTLRHRLKTSEVYFILSGRGLMRINGTLAPVKPGDTVYIAPRSLQCIKNVSRSRPLKFICIVDPAWRARDEEILEAFV